MFACECPPCLARWQKQPLTGVNQAEHIEKLKSQLIAGGKKPVPMESSEGEDEEVRGDGARNPRPSRPSAHPSEPPDVPSSHPPAETPLFGVPRVQKPELRPFQQTVLELLEQPSDGRTIYWIHEPEGGSGKNKVLVPWMKKHHGSLTLQALYSLNERSLYSFGSSGGVAREEPSYM